MAKKPNQVISKVRTGTGDDGTTFLVEPGVPKDAADVQFVGDLDEANAFIGGLFPSEAHNGVIWKRLKDSQEVLFAMGAAVHSQAAQAPCDRLLETYIDDIEVLLEKIRGDEHLNLVPLEGFVWPNLINTKSMVARAVVRRAERSAVACGAMWAVPALNTMSDFLFMLAWISLEPTDQQWSGFDDTP